MSVEFGNNSHKLICDECERRPEYYFSSWRIAWETAKGDGWTGEKDTTGAWVHRCPECNKLLEEERNLLRERRKQFMKKKKKKRKKKP